MTPAVLVLAVVLAAFAGAWLTRPWWRTAVARTSMAVPIDTVPRSRGLHLGVAGAALAVIAGVAWWAVDRANATREVERQAVSATVPSAEAVARVKASVERLRAQVEAHPDDASAWETLGVSHAALGHHAEAIDALRHAQKLRPDDATVLAEMALSLVIADPKQSAGEPGTLIARALALEPSNRKALALAGTLALQRHDYAEAVRHWEALARVEPSNTPAAKQLQVGLAEARSRAAIFKARSTATAQAKTTAPANVASGTWRVAANEPSAPVAAPRITGTVSLAAGLRGKVEPEDTVFVFARALDAGGPPLAVVKRQVRDLPFSFTLDDSASMNGMRLSSASHVAVAARISKSGQAIAHPGDLEGRLESVALGSSDLKLQIDAVVPPKP